MYCFTMRIDAAAVKERILDPCYNKVSGGDFNYQLALPFAFVTFVQIAELRSGTPPQNEWGYSPEQEMAIWLMVEDLDRRSAAWIQPYIIVDNTTAMSSGREIYGFPKAMGEFELPPYPVTTPPKSGEKLVCKTLVMPTYRPSTKSAVLPLVSAEPHAQRSSGPLEWSSMEEAVRSVLFMLGKVADNEAHNLVSDAISFLRDPEASARRAVQEVETGLDYAEHLLGGGVPLMLLKQFPGVGADGKACYQSIVHVDSALRSFQGGGLLDYDYRLKLGDYDSHPVVRDLGLSGPDTLAELSYYLDFDFEFKPGRVVWPESGS